ncbi:MAG: class I SAM-dependent methyltransferase [Cyclobacteriaceae bacterium]|nr:class I SAM-dependent methyltransferase [Cyclobacteriaceae bacterium]
MTKKLIKGLGKAVGVDVRRYNRETDTFKSLHRKYHDYTMIPEDAFVCNLQLCTKFFTVPGDVVECGVWRGGMIAAIAELSGNTRRVHLFDSFEGLPEAKEIDGKEALQWQANKTSPHYYNNCYADESFALNALKLAAHTNFQIYKGWFQNTLSTYQGNPIAILRLDGDWYDSVKVCLEKLYPLVSEGGLIIIDDYYTWDGCSKAIHDYLSEIKSASRVFQWNNQVGYIIKKS